MAAWQSVGTLQRRVPTYANLAAIPSSLKYDGSQVFNRASRRTVTWVGSENNWDYPFDRTVGVTLLRTGSNQNIASGADRKMTFDYVRDTPIGVSVNANKDTVTIQKAGVYSISAVNRMGTATTQYLHVASGDGISNAYGANSTPNLNVAVTGIAPLVAGDTLSAWLWYNVNGVVKIGEGVNPALSVWMIQPF